MDKIENIEGQKWKAEAGWLDGAVYDSIFIYGVMAIALLSGLIVCLEPSLFYPVLYLDVILLGYHHVIATFTKLAGTKEDRQENRFLIYVLPIIVLLGVLGLYSMVGIWIIGTIYFVWQWFHYTRQVYGINVFYRRKSKKVFQKNSLVNLLPIWSIPIWGMLNRCSQGWEEFLSLAFYLPKVSGLVATIAGYVAVATVILWLGSKIKEYRQGTLSIAETTFVASHMLIFYVGYVLISDITMGWLVVNVWHNAQYIMFVWLYNVNRFGAIKETKKVPHIQLVSKRKPVKILSYFIFTLALTVLFYAGMNMGLEFISTNTGIILSNLFIIGYQSVNFHHYIVDSVIWKARNKKNQKAMKIG